MYFKLSIIVRLLALKIDKIINLQVWIEFEEQGSVRTELTFTVSEYGQGSCDEAHCVVRAQLEHLAMGHLCSYGCKDENQPKLKI